MGSKMRCLPAGDALSGLKVFRTPCRRRSILYAGPQCTSQRRNGTQLLTTINPPFDGRAGATPPAAFSNSPVDANSELEQTRRRRSVIRDSANGSAGGLGSGTVSSSSVVSSNGLSVQCRRRSHFCARCADDTSSTAKHRTRKSQATASRRAMRTANGMCNESTKRYGHTTPPAGMCDSSQTASCWTIE